MKATHTRSTLSAVQGRIGLALDNLTSLIATMKSHEIESLDINYQVEMTRGLDGIDDFVAYGQRTARWAMNEKGLFGAVADGR